MNSRILIVDDEPAIARVLRPVLQATGATVFSAATAAEGLEVAAAEPLDIVLLDLGLPDADGRDLIPEFRSREGIAVIVVSARHREADKVSALDAGADDYVDKPFNIEELLARIRAAERRLPQNSRRGLTLDCGPLVIETATRQVRLQDESIRLSPKEFALLRVLAERAGQAVTHRRLLLAGWGDPAADPQYLRSYIALLRQKLEEDPAEPRLILSEPGVGYRLQVPKDRSPSR